MNSCKYISIYIHIYIYIYIYVYQLAKRHCGGCSHGVQSGVAPVLLLAAMLLLSRPSLKHSGHLSFSSILANMA